MAWKLNLKLPSIHPPPDSIGTEVGTTACASLPTGQCQDEEVTFLVPSERLEAATLHARYLDDVFRYVARRIPEREEAEDITAEVFAAAFQALPRFRGQCEPRLWLLGIARRKIADALRRSKKRRETSASDLAASSMESGEAPYTQGANEPALALERGEAQRTVRLLMQGLKEEQREVLLLKYVEGLSINEIAVVMGRSPAAVNSLLQRARATVFRQGRDYFEDDTQESEVTP